MTEKPLVSVIINCYNGEKYLREAIDSVMAQTYENWELVFWDNQSTDSTREIVESYADPRIHYFYAPQHTPLGEARNLAMKKVRGDFLSFLDSDDKWESGFIQKGVETLEENDTCPFFYSNFYYNDKKGNFLSHDRQDSDIKGFSSICHDYRIGMSAVMLKAKSVFENGVEFNTNYNLVEDYDFFLRLSLWGNFVYCPIPLMYYRRHAGSLTNTKFDQWAKEYKSLYNYFEINYVKTGRLKTADIKPIYKEYIISQIYSCLRNKTRGPLWQLFLKHPQYIFPYRHAFLFLILPLPIYNSVYKVGE